MEPIEQVKVAVLEEQMKTLGRGLELLGNKIDELTNKIDNNYVKKEDFKPVKETVETLKYWQAKVIGYAGGIVVIVELLLKYYTKQ